MTHPYQDPYSPQGSYGQPGSPSGGQQPGVFGAGSGFQQPGAISPGNWAQPAFSVQHPARPHVGFGTACKAFFKNYATFTGRASRSEFWWAWLLHLLISLVCMIPAIIGGLTVPDSDNSYQGTPWLLMLGGGLYLVWLLAAAIPLLAIQVRRLHDAGKSGWWILLHLASSVGSVVLLVFWLQGSDPAGVRFDDPSGKQPYPEPMQAPGATPYQA